MRILITGCNGFVARNLATYLSRNHTVISTNRTTLDVLDEGKVSVFLDKNNIDIVIHAAVSGGRRNEKDNFSVLVDNLKMFDNFKKNREKYKYLFHFGSGAEFDRRRDIKSATEDMQSSPVDYYGLSKKIIKTEMDKTEGFYNFRLFGCFGEDEDDTRFIKSAITNINNNKPIIIHQNKIMDYVYVGDVARVIQYYIENIPKKTLIKDINLCYNEKHSLLEIAEYLINISEKECKITTSQEGLSSEYTGAGENMQNLGLQFDGLWKSISRVYSLLKRE
jgi:UDP-glucose 4-epimerase